MILENLHSELNKSINKDENKPRPGGNDLNEYYLQKNSGEIKEEEVVDETNEQSVLNATMKKFSKKF